MPILLTTFSTSVIRVLLALIATECIDGWALYSLRVAIIEPPFAHICRIMGLDRFTLHSKTKVNIQWNLFCIVHIQKKVARYGPSFA